MMMIRGREVLLMVMLGVIPVAGETQSLRIGGGPLIGTSRFASELGSLTEDVSGIVYGAQVYARLGVVGLDVSYLQGTLDGGTEERDLVEAEVMLGVRPIPWLTAKFGPQIRAYTTTGGTERWVLWEGRLRAETGVFAPIVRSYVEGWLAFGGSINLQESFDGGEGFEAGMRIQFPSAPVGLRLGYRVERDRLSGPVRRDTLQQILAGVIIGRY